MWLSDSNDASERLRTQHQASNFLPMAVTGSHVGPRECHTSGRLHSIEFRAWVAAQRHMGFEMDPRELNSDELSILKRITHWWKDNRIWRYDADILRLNVVDNSIAAEIQVSRNKDKFVVFVGITETSKWSSPAPIRLCGLKPNYLYDITLLNNNEKTSASRGEPVFIEGKITLSGQHLMSNGVTLPCQFPDRIWVLEGALSTS